METITTIQDLFDDWASGRVSMIHEYSDDFRTSFQRLYVRAKEFADQHNLKVPSCIMEELTAVEDIN